MFPYFIKELKNGYFISGGDKKLFVYNEKYHQVIDINMKNYISNVTEIKTIEKTERSRREIKLIICAKGETPLLIINTEKNEYKIKNNKSNVSTTFCLEIKKNSYLALRENEVYVISDLFNKIIASNRNKLFDGTYKGAIKLSKNIFALSSNKILKNGENKLKFYNSNSKRIVKEINGYSFIASSNGLVLMPKEESETSKILLCACKKYQSNQKNGILLVNANIEKMIEINNPFYNTGNFEVHCFCPLSVKPKRNYIKIFNDDEIIETDYFLVGGYDKSKGRGKIKLYKLIRNNNIKDTKIQFIQDIDVKKTKQFNGFKDPINCITQSRQDLKILISCMDGNIYLLSSPNIDIFTKYEEKTKYDLISTQMENKRKEIIVSAE